MHIAPNDSDQLPEETITSRVNTYGGMMHFGYVWFLPLVLAFVMIITVLMLKGGILTAIGVGFLTFLGVLAISKTFFVH
ncbi:MAG: hypothetical protein AAF788_01885 [Pseudomonadota bacterium]